MAVTIASLELENVKRVKAVKLEPSEAGLTIIGGNNRQGKTSVLDAIMWALGGNDYKPSNPQNAESVTPPYERIVLSNGYIVERKGKNSALTVTDPTGQKAGQTLLNSFISKLALDLPKFMEAKDKEKADTLLQIIGVGDELARLDRKEKELVNDRLLIGRVADQKEKAVKEMVFYADAPDELVSAAELIQRQQSILAINGENQRKREKASQLEWQEQAKRTEVEQMRALLAQKEEELLTLQTDLETARASALDLMDEATDEIEASIANIEDTNRKVRANLDRSRAEDEAKQYRSQYDGFTIQIQSVRDERTALLDGAELPLEGLSVVDGELVYNGQKWDGMSGAEQLIVATAIVRKLNPECGFVLLDKLEQMDAVTLKEFGAWLEKEGLQAIATRVSTGEECTIIIEDGYVVKEKKAEPKAEPKKWEAGVF